jgi:hypothetical protein
LAEDIVHLAVDEDQGWRAGSHESGHGHGRLIMTIMEVWPTW